MKRASGLNFEDGPLLAECIKYPPGQVRRESTIQAACNPEGGARGR